eukprot:TRINITY_DN23967_c0_g1_i1.p1 TRINITY_DN23967_c0_g1~~TRINITY_DN23967_c0_g1_i1.p1  ORF type:complete len:104 (-),score=21.25 TRINITY_DN23967_c0_g1_i1:119-430(-)
MIRRPPRSTQSRSSAASDVYKRQVSMRISPKPSWLRTSSNSSSNFCLADSAVLLSACTIQLQPCFVILDANSSEFTDLTFCHVYPYSALILSLIHISEPTRPY